MGLSEAAKLYIKSQPLKCIAGAAQETTSGCGHTCGSIVLPWPVGAMGPFSKCERDSEVENDHDSGVSLEKNET